MGQLLAGVHPAVLVFLVCVMLALLIASARYVIGHHRHHNKAMRAPAHGFVEATEVVEAEQGEEDDEETDDSNVFDIESSDDEELELQDGEDAILMFFFYNGSEVCDEQWGAVNQLSLKLENVRFVSVDAFDQTTAPIAAFHNIHQAPAFVLRRRGESVYHTLNGLQSKTQLEAFITTGLATAQTL